MSSPGFQGDALGEAEATTEAPGLGTAPPGPPTSGPPGAVSGTAPFCAATAAAASLVYAASAPNPLAAVIGRYPGGSSPMSTPGCWPWSAAKSSSCARCCATVGSRPVVGTAAYTTMVPG